MTVRLVIIRAFRSRSLQSRGQQSLIRCALGLQAILGATEKGIQLRPILDRSQILLCNLSKGTVGHDSSTLLGSLLLSSLQVAAMSRADVPEDP